MTSKLNELVTNKLSNNGDDNGYQKNLDRWSKRLSEKHTDFITFLDQSKSYLTSKSTELVELFLYNTMINNYGNTIEIRSYLSNSHFIFYINGLGINLSEQLPKIKVDAPITDQLLKDLTKKMGLSDRDLVAYNKTLIGYNDLYLRKFYKNYIKQYFNILNSKLSNFNADKFNLELIDVPLNLGYKALIKLDTIALELINNVKFNNEKYIIEQQNLRKHIKDLEELENQINKAIYFVNKKVLSHDVRDKIADGLYNLIKGLSKEELLGNKIKIRLLSHRKADYSVRDNCLFLSIDSYEIINVENYPKDILQKYNLNHRATYKRSENIISVVSDLDAPEILEYYANQVIEVLKFNNIKAKVNIISGEIVIAMQNIEN